MVKRYCPTCHCSCNRRLKFVVFFGHRFHEILWVLLARLLFRFNKIRNCLIYLVSESGKALIFLDVDFGCLLYRRSHQRDCGLSDRLFFSFFSGINHHHVVCRPESFAWNWLWAPDFCVTVRSYQMADFICVIAVTPVLGVVCSAINKLDLTAGTHVVLRLSILLSCNTTIVGLSDRI